MWVRSMQGNSRRGSAIDEAAPRRRKSLVPWLTALCALVALICPAAADPIRIVAFGDSLMAGYGVPAQSAFPVRLEAALKAKGYDVRVANAGVSGDTASAGLARLDWTVPAGTDAVILELGANDALRGIDPKVTRDALEIIVRRLKERRVEVLLAGMQAPRNLGIDYAARFDPIYPELGKKFDLLLYPFFLDGVATDPKLNLRDGIHPTAEGIDVIVSRILPSVEALIARARARGR